MENNDRETTCNRVGQELVKAKSQLFLHRLTLPTLTSSTMSRSYESTTRPSTSASSTVTTLRPRTGARPRTAASNFGPRQNIICAVTESRGVSATVGLCFVNTTNGELHHPRRYQQLTLHQQNVSSARFEIPRPMSARFKSCTSLTPARLSSPQPLSPRAKPRSLP